jgi:PilZ domain
MFDIDRRKYPRANYPCLLTIWLEEGLNETILANTSNIGVGGLYVRLNQRIDPGTKVDVQVNFPDTAAPYRCRGVVLRSMRASERIYNISIQFEPLNEFKHAFIEKKISEILAFERKGKS